MFPVAYFLVTVKHTTIFFGASLGLPRCLHHRSLQLAKPTFFHRLELRQKYRGAEALAVGVKHAEGARNIHLLGEWVHENMQHQCTVKNADLHLCAILCTCTFVHNDCVCPLRVLKESQKKHIPQRNPKNASIKYLSHYLCGRCIHERFTSGKHRD